MSFGTGGKVLTNFGPGSNSARAVAMQTDGKIVAAGESGSGDFALARYNVDGSLDTSFGSGGMVTIDVGVSDVAFAVAVQTDGRIVAAGGTTAPELGCCQFALIRLNSNGSLDTGFDGDGKVTTLFGGDTRAFAMAIQSDGRIVAAGGTFSPFAEDFAVARYNADGSLDQSFGIQGRVTTDFGGVDHANGVVVQTDGKIVAVGSGGPVNDFVLTRYNPDGSLDTSFATDGRVTTDFGGNDGANAVALQTDGKIVAAGRGGFFTRFALARYSIDGTLDASFDLDGMVTTEFFGENIESAEALAIQTNGKIVAVGSVFSSFDPSFALVRFDTDGSLDLSFGTGGQVTTDFGDPSEVGVLCPPARKDCSEDLARAVTLQGDGKIVAVGGAGPCTPACSFALARYEGDPLSIEISIDIRPGSVANPLNLSSSGLLPVAIITTDAFDGTTVTPGTACFGDDGDPNGRDCSEAHGMSHFEDVNGDGRLDQLLHFNVQQTGIDPEDTRACLTATTFDGIDVQGCDVIVIVAR